MRNILPLIFGIGLLYSATVAISVGLKSSYLEASAGPDIIQNIFGGMREAVGDWAAMKSEEYFHKGLPYMKAIAFHEGRSGLDDASGTEEGRQEHHHESGAAPKDLYEKLYAAVKVTEHSHLESSAQKEVLPWFYLEVRFNPKDIRGYVLGGYYLERLGKLDESLRFLKEGEKNNPAAARIKASIGWVYWKMKDQEDAVAYLEEARALWMEGKYPNIAVDDYSHEDRLLTFDLLGDIYEGMGDHGKALRVYKEGYKFEPSPKIMEKIRELFDAK